MPLAKKPKMEPGEAMAELPFDISQYVRNGTVEKLKVDELKLALKAIGVPVSSRKKAELVEDVYKKYKVWVTPYEKNKFLVS